MKVAYYPGCTLETTGIEFNLSTEYCAKKVDLDLWEIPSWNCCGASSAHTVDHLLALALPARNLAIAEKEGLDVAVPCAACYTHFKNVETAVRQDEEVQQEVAQVIDMDYHATNNTRSILEVFVDKVGLNAIGAEITKPLTGLKVACYYGCFLVRPPKLGHFDDRTEDPQSMDDLITALGGTPVEWPHKTECCGAGMVTLSPENGLPLSYELLRAAQLCGADCIAAACPMCQMNLDLRQEEIKKKYKADFNLPIYYFTELMALSFGASTKEIGLEKHFVDSVSLAMEIGRKETA
jgi:heterodisulfide reductase subunit B